jgi:uncharacterized protein (TIGR02001 family)
LPVPAIAAGIDKDAVRVALVKRGSNMKKFLIPAVAAGLLSVSPALAADLKMITKAPPAPAFTPGWEHAYGAAIATDYNFRGISQSNRKPSVFAYFEPRYNVSPNLQLYVGVSGYSISFPNRAAAEIDFYGGVRPTFGSLAFDFGIWYYYYPGGQCYATGVAGCLATLPNGNVAKADFSFIEYYGKVSHTWMEVFTLGAGVYHAPNWLNTGATGTYASATAKYTLPASMFPKDVGMYWSGEIGRYWLGTTDAFYGTVNLPDYTTWNLGFGITYKLFTLDFRYHDTDLSKVNCNVITGDHTATPTGPGGAVESKWCGQAFIVKLSVDGTIK